MLLPLLYNPGWIIYYQRYPRRPIAYKGTLIKVNETGKYVSPPPYEGRESYVPIQWLLPGINDCALFHIVRRINHGCL